MLLSFLHKLSPPFFLSPPSSLSFPFFSHPFPFFFSFPSPPLFSPLLFFLLVFPLVSFLSHLFLYPLYFVRSPLPTLPFSPPPFPSFFARSATSLCYKHIPSIYIITFDTIVTILMEHACTASSNHDMIHDNHCAVFGWAVTSLVDVERESGYMLEIGYIKGSSETAAEFKIVVSNGTACK